MFRRDDFRLNVDVAVQNPAWVPNGASAGHSTASFVVARAIPTIFRPPSRAASRSGFRGPCARTRMQNPRSSFASPSDVSIQRGRSLAAGRVSRRCSTSIARIIEVTIGDGGHGGVHRSLPERVSTVDGDRRGLRRVAAADACVRRGSARRPTAFRFSLVVLRVRYGYRPRRMPGWVRDGTCSSGSFGFFVAQPRSTDSGLFRI